MSSVALPSHTAVRPAAKPTLVNPYLESWLEQGRIELARASVTTGTSTRDQLNRTSRMTSIRRDLVKKYSFAIPTEDAIRTICRYSPLIEIGAGTGYWAWLIRQLGGGIIAYDINPPTHQASPIDNRYHGNEGCWTQVEQGTTAKISDHPDRTLLMSWPPFGEPLALNALQAYRGEHFLYIGALPLPNGWKGPMGSDDFLDELKRDWSLELTLHLPNWDLCWDALHVFKRQTIARA